MVSASVSDTATAESWPSAQAACSSSHHFDVWTADTSNGSGNAGASGNGESAATIMTSVISGGTISVVVAVLASSPATEDLNAAPANAPAALMVNPRVKAAELHSLSSR